MQAPAEICRAGDTLLIHAARHGHLSTVEALLDACGADMEGRNAEGETALSVACWSAHLDVAHCLLRRGASVAALAPSETLRGTSAAYRRFLLAGAGMNSFDES